MATLSSMFLLSTLILLYLCAMVLSGSAKGDYRDYNGKPRARGGDGDDNDEDGDGDDDDEVAGDGGDGEVAGGGGEVAGGSTISSPPGSGDVKNVHGHDTQDDQVNAKDVGVKDNHNDTKDNHDDYNEEPPAQGEDGDDNDEDGDGDDDDEVAGGGGDGEVAGDGGDDEVAGGSTISSSPGSEIEPTHKVEFHFVPENLDSTNPEKKSSINETIPSKVNNAAPSFKSPPVRQTLVKMVISLVAGFLIF